MHARTADDEDERPKPGSVMLSPFASLRVHSAKHLAAQREILRFAQDDKRRPLQLSLHHRLEIH
jgi:hypothetical protein